MANNMTPDRFIAAAFREWADRKKGAGLPEDDIIYSIEQKAAELARESVGDVERDARTLLAAEYERDGWEQTAYAVRIGWKSADAEPALRAIISALAGVSEGKEKP